MDRQPNDRWQHVRDWLRRNDPGGERPLDAREQREMRRRMLADLDERRHIARWRWDWGLGAAGLLIVVAGLIWWGWEASRGVSPQEKTFAQVARLEDPGVSHGDGPDRPRGTGTEGRPRAATLELRFAAPNGTQLVWILQTDRED